jgi:hypothetical protein
MRLISFINAGHITNRESAVNAVTQWANDCERKVLIDLSCGVVVPRERHRAWALEQVSNAKFLMRRKNPRFVIIGMEHTGPQYGEELDALRAALNSEGSDHAG